MKTLARLVMVLVLCLNLSSCCKPGDNSGWCKTSGAVVDCAKLEGSKVLTDMISEIEGIIAATKGDWMVLLGQLEAKGADLFACAWGKITNAPVASAVSSVRHERLKAYSSVRKARKP